MGVKGLWTILAPTSETLPSQERLKDHRLAIDASIWMYQLTKALPTNESLTKSGGTYNPLVLAGLVRRVCKLLHFGIKPVFIFDGGVPLLKASTISERRSKRAEAESRYKRLAKKMLKLRMSMIALGVETDINDIRKENKEYDKFNEEEEFSDSDYEDELDYEQLEGVDIDSEEFKALPLDLRQELLLALKDKVFTEQLSKSRTSGHVEDSLDFSRNQIDSLVKRRKIIEELEKVSRSDFGSFGSGKHDNGASHRIAASSSREYVLVKTETGGWVFEQPQNEKAKRTAIVETVEEDNFDEEFFADDHEVTISELISHDINVQSETVVQVNIIDQTERPANTLSIAVETNETDLKVINELEQFDRNKIVFDEDHRLQVSSEDEQELPTIEKALDHQKPAFDIDERKAAVDEELVSDIVERKAAVDEELVSDIVERKASVDEELVSDIVERKAAVDEEFYLEEDDEENFLEEFNYKTTNDLIERLQESMKKAKGDLNSAQNESRMIEDELTLDFQKLLNLFGLPWMISPMEAEAQCAWLCYAGLVDGVITDDSDVLVFTPLETNMLIYRYFFKDKHPVQIYSMARIQLQMDLSRADLVVLAMLLGGDYGVGVRGIGAKRGVELLRILKQADSIAKCKISLSEFDYCMKILNLLRKAVLNFDEIEAEFEFELQQKLEKISSIIHHLDDDFPSKSIIEAYLCPRINEDKRPFSWTTPNAESLEQFLSRSVGWSPSQIRSIIYPILKQL